MQDMTQDAVASHFAQAPLRLGPGDGDHESAANNVRQERPRESSTTAGITMSRAGGRGAPMGDLYEELDFTSIVRAVWQEVCLACLHGVVAALPSFL